LARLEVGYETRIQTQEDMMSGLMWVVLVAAVIVVALIAMTVARRRRSAALQQHFGTEYDRTVQANDGRRAAEAELRGREKQRAQLDIRPLSAATRDRAGQEWSDIQARFVDQPSTAVISADALVCRVMGERGYPMTDFEAQAELVSVDHPAVVENFRVAHGIFGRAQNQQASTEDLREALLRYRSLFDELLHDGADESAETRRTATAANGAVMEQETGRERARHAAGTDYEDDTMGGQR
jgi:hypothetical protein